MIKGSTILIIGAGQIGCSACVEILKRKPKNLILHTLTDKESEDSLNWVRSNCQVIETELIPSAGDVLAAFPGSTKKSIMSEIKYRFDTFTPELCQSSPLWKLIEKFRPDMIVDGINTATIVGYGNDLYTTSREIIGILENNELPEAKVINELLRKSLLAEAIPPLVRFIQILHKAMIEFKVKRYVKISTSGLGGMGLNIKYTHGDIGEPGCSPRLLGKVAAAGIFNALLWTLSHTPGLDIKMIIPTALVGWESITSDVQLKIDGVLSAVPLVDCQKPLDLTQANAFSNHRPIKLNDTLKMAAINSGENGYYGIADMTTITTLGQMGCITKEEVGIAVAESLEGSTRYDMCTAMDSACLGPSFNAAFERRYILEKMKEMDRKLETRSVAAGNLGPTVTKHLWELEILRILRASVSNVANSNPDELSAEAEQLVLQTDIALRRQILSLQMPILLEKSRLLLGESWHIPEEKHPQNIMENIEIWADKGWVDLRSERMKYWQMEFKKIHKFLGDRSQLSQVMLQRNYRIVTADDDFDPGEVLGLIYSINGGDRKL